MRKRGLRFLRSLSVKIIAPIGGAIILSLLPISILEVRTEEGTAFCSLFFNSEIILKVSYTHSVSLTQVIDTYRIDRKGIWAIEERWQQFDAGQPIDFDEIETGFFIKKLNMLLGREWSYWFIPINKVSIVLNNEYIFRDIEREGKVVFRIKKIPLIITLTRQGGLKAWKK